MEGVQHDLCGITWVEVKICLADLRAHLPLTDFRLDNGEGLAVLEKAAAQNLHKMKLLAKGGGRRRNVRNPVDTTQAVAS